MKEQNKLLTTAMLLGLILVPSYGASELDVNKLEQQNIEASSGYSSRLVAGPSQIGNQNTTAIGTNTFVEANEKTEDEFQSIDDLSKTNDKFYSIEDLNTDIVKEVIDNVKISESIRPMTKEQASQLGYEQTITFNGADWNISAENEAKITTKNTNGANSVVIENYGLYYNFNTLDYAPVDLEFTIDYIDYWNTTAVNKGLDFRYTNGSIALSNYNTDEIQITTHYTRNDTGKEVNVPIIYNMTDMDAGVSMGFKEEDILGYGAYYVNGSKSSNSSLGDYTTENDVVTDGTKGGDVWNYESYLSYVSSVYSKSEGGGTFYNSGDRADYNDSTALTDSSGNLTAKERGWNRLKYREKNGFITIQDMWGANSNGTYGDGGKSYTMKTNGKESKFTTVLNSNFTFTLNFSNALMNIPISNAGATQTISLKPYAFEGSTLIQKSITDANEDEVIQNGENIKYTIDVYNPDPFESVQNVEVRDSMLEDTPSYLTYNNDLNITGYDNEGNEYSVASSGEITDGTLVLDELQKYSYAEITYTMKASDELSRLDSDLVNIDNVATDDGSNPKSICTDELELIECDSTITPIQPDPVITKLVTDENDDMLADVGETLSYTVKVDNQNDVSINSILIRDSMFENELPYYLEMNNINVIGNDFDVETSGDLSKGNFIINEIPANSSVDITYDLTLTTLPNPEEVQSINNIATDNGENPEVCEEEDKGKDCDSTITPINPKTIISKSVSDESGDGILQNDEILRYTITVQNQYKLSATNVIIRDSLLENLPEYVDYNNNPTVEGSKFDVETTGDLSKGDFSINEIPGKSSVKLIYELKVNDIPEDVESLLNIVTDNGEDPEVCEDEDKGKDCDEAIIPTEPNTLINKSVVDDNKDGIVQDNEVLTYKINVANESKITAKNVIVRDSLLENLPEYVTIEEEPIATGSKFDVKTTGDLTSGDFTIGEIPAKSNVVITYSLKVDEVPEDIESILNIVTDNGEDPLVCKDEDKGKDCDEAVIPIHAETLIEKSVTDENEDGVVQEGEVLNYLITVTNPTGNNISDVNVRDSLLEDLPEYLTYNEDLKINPTETKSSGDLSKGDFTLETVEANSVVEISYSLTANEVPKKINEVVNIVTDNGDDPEVCKEESQGIDCDTATIPKEKIRLITVKEEEEDTPSMPHTGM